MGEAFEILITRQGWLGEDDPNLDYDPARIDLCSHGGGVRLTIDSRVISTGEHDDEYGISESALALLRTLESDHSPRRPVAERLVFHGCGLMLMTGCPVEYRRHVVAFAEKAKEPFMGIEREFSDDHEQRQYEEFWEEFDARLSRAVAKP